VECGVPPAAPVAFEELVDPVECAADGSAGDDDMGTDGTDRETIVAEPAVRSCLPQKVGRVASAAQQYGTLGEGDRIGDHGQSHAGHL